MAAQLLQQVGQIGIPVKDLDRAITFYSDILNLPLLFQTERMAFYDLNGLRIMLSLPEKEEFAHTSSVLYYQVEDIQAVCKELLAKGAAFSGEPHVVTRMDNIETWMAFFTDSEGNTMALVSEVSV